MRRRSFVVFVVASEKAYLLRKRPVGSVNAGLWEFPSIETTVDHLNSETLNGAAKACLGWAPPALKELFRIRHTITTNRIELSVVQATGGNRRRRRRLLADGMEGWYSLHELHQLPFSGAHRKIAERISGGPSPLSS
jgi:adenine-specific DNA glycosylase